jgi:hypothetical protein
MMLLNKKPRPLGEVHRVCVMRWLRRTKPSPLGSANNDIGKKPDRHVHVAEPYHELAPSVKRAGAQATLTAGLARRLK